MAANVIKLLFNTLLLIDCIIIGLNLLSKKLFQSEVMQIHLDTSESKRGKCECSLTEALSTCNILQKDKEIQEGNYKTQLSTMSEHLANMNEKLISQTEEIQQLKFELTNKVNINNQ